MKTQLLSHLLIISFLFLLSCSGMEGTKGADGARGPKGDTGATGPQGPKGDKGEKGDQGDQGDKGDKGDKGDTTLAGSGATGARGPKGDKGDKGDTGARGPKGDKGDSGSGGLSAKYYDISVTFSKQNDKYGTRSDYQAIFFYDLPQGTIEANDVVMVFNIATPIIYPLPHTFMDDKDPNKWVRYTFLRTTSSLNRIMLFRHQSGKKLFLDNQEKFRVVVIKATVGKAPTFPSSLDLGNYDAVKEHFGLD